MDQFELGARRFAKALNLVIADINHFTATIGSTAARKSIAVHGDKVLEGVVRAYFASSTTGTSEQKRIMRAAAVTNVCMAGFVNHASPPFLKLANTFYVPGGVWHRATLYEAIVGYLDRHVDSETASQFVRSTLIHELEWRVLSVGRRQQKAAKTFEPLDLTASHVRDPASLLRSWLWQKGLDRSCKLWFRWARGAKYRQMTLIVSGAPVLSCQAESRDKAWQLMRELAAIYFNLNGNGAVSEAMDSIN